MNVLLHVYALACVCPCMCMLLHVYACVCSRMCMSACASSMVTIHRTERLPAWLVPFGNHCFARERPEYLLPVLYHAARQHIGAMPTSTVPPSRLLPSLLHIVGSQAR